MNDSDIESLLDKWGLGWQRGKAPHLIWIGAGGKKGEYQIRLHLDEERLLVAYIFSELPLGQTAEALHHLLEINDQLTVFKVATDERRRVVLLATWPALYLTADNLGFLITDIIETIDRLREDVVIRLQGIVPHQAS